MIRLLLVVGILVALFYALRWFSKAKVEDAKRATRNALLLMLLAVVLFLSVTGKLHWIFAVVGMAIPLLGKAWRAWQAFNWLRSRVKPQQQRQKSTVNKKNFEITVAHTTLGLQENAGRDEIISAHRKLMSQAHPDKGGSDQQAQQINAAKDLLLKNIEGK